MALAILLFAICLGALGQILLKSGLQKLGPHPAPGLVVAQIVTNIRVFGGFCCYAISSLFYLVALSRMELSYAYPIIALSYVLVTFLAWRFLGEQVPGLRVVGLAIIIVGVVVMALSFKRTHAEASPTSLPPVTQLAPPR